MTTKKKRLLLLAVLSLPILVCLASWVRATGFSREAQLEKALQGVNRIRVRSGGTCHRQIEQERTLIEESEASKVADICRSIRIDEWGSGGCWGGFHCMCCGNPSIEFYRDDDLILTLGFHHGRSVRWAGGWKWDGLLTRESATKLTSWLAEHGVQSETDEW
jgi:hypothetical protein